MKRFHRWEAGSSYLDDVGRESVVGLKANANQEFGRDEMHEVMVSEKGIPKIRGI
jgi:hypothetical protein